MFSGLYRPDDGKSPWHFGDGSYRKPTYEQVLSLGVDHSSLTDEAWEMCDFIEHFIADRCDGLIYAPGEAIFDANLQPVAKVISKP
jgi:hypothetical protein